MDVAEKVEGDTVAEATVQDVMAVVTWVAAMVVVVTAVAEMVAVVTAVAGMVEGARVMAEMVEGARVMVAPAAQAVEGGLGWEEEVRYEPVMCQD